MRALPSSIILGALLLALSGCTARVDLPPGYVPLRDPAPYDFKAVSAEGTVIALRSRPNEAANADLAFWSQAVEHQKVDLDGLRLAAREELQSATGQPGTLFTFELGHGQGQVRYLVALYVTPRTITTVEIGGAAERIDRDLPALRTALRSVRL